MLKDAILTRLVAIGELTTHFTDEFKEMTQSDVNWNDLKKLRNVCVHRYGTIDFDLIYDIVKTEIPPIHAFCQKKANEYIILQQESVESPIEDDE